MESKIKYYKSGNYIISALFIVLLGMLLYCAKVVEQDRVIYYLSMLCIGAWACLFYNNLKKERKEVSDNNSEVAVVIAERDTNKVTSRAEEPDFEEEAYRVNMLNNAIKSTLIVIDNEEQSIGTGVILSKNGVVMISKYYFSDKVNESSVEIGEEILFKKYSSDKAIRGTVIKEVLDEEGNVFSLVKINEDTELLDISIGNSSEISIGSKVYGLNAFRGNASINVIEGVISQVKQFNTIDIDGVEVFKSSNCFLYNGVSTDESIGGPLLNSDGELIGILLGRSKHYDRLNFALPINEIKSGLYEVGILSKDIDLGSDTGEVDEVGEILKYSDDKGFEEEKEELINKFNEGDEEFKCVESDNSICDVEYVGLQVSDTIDYNEFGEEHNEIINEVDNTCEDSRIYRNSDAIEEYQLEIDNSTNESDRDFEEEKEEMINKFDVEYKYLDEKSSIDNTEKLELKVSENIPSALEIYSYNFKYEENLNIDEVYNVNAYNEDDDISKTNSIKDGTGNPEKIEIYNMKDGLEKIQDSGNEEKSEVEDKSREMNGINKGGVSGLEIVNPLQDGVEYERGNM